MRILPLLFNSNLSEDDIYRHETSDRIWVHQRIFERWMNAEEAGTVVSVLLGHVPACMFAPHNHRRNVIYAPTWMCEELGVSCEMGDEDEDEDDYITMERLQPNLCTFVRLQPLTSDHLPSSVGGQGGEEMPEDTLSRGFEEYTCIREGQTLNIRLPWGSRMFVTITEAHPQGKGALLIRNGEIAMDLLEPLDRPAHTPEPLPTPPPEPEVVPTVPAVPAVPIETREERRERLARAALARMQPRPVSEIQAVPT